MTWRELLAEAGEKLEKAGVPEPEADAWALFTECFQMSRAMYFLKRDELIPGAETLSDGKWLADGEGKWADEAMDGAKVRESDVLRRFVRFIRQRSERIPLQQITGHQEFMGLDFAVNEHVLIPRQDTEILVEAVLEDLKRCAVSAKDREKSAEKPSMMCGQVFEFFRILDMCAGSGCIGISLERLAPVPVSVLGADISEEALKVAKGNGERLGCVHYRTVNSDLFEAIYGQFEVIVSNPPYIPTEVIGTLDAEVKDHEPHLALDGEADGLAFYRRIIGEAPSYLTENGRVYVEIGYDQGEAVSGLLREAGFTEVRVICDLAGLDRVVAAVWRG